MKVVFWGAIPPCEVTRNMYMMAELFSLYDPSAKIHVFRKRQDREQGRNRFRTPQAFLKEENRYQKTGTELSFYDCGNLLDSGTRRQMGEADLVVVNMPQSKKGWEQLGVMGLLHMEKTLFLMTNYFEGNSVNREAIEKQYRVDVGKIGIIPYNNEFYYAVGQGKITEFLCRKTWRSEKNKMLRDELERTLFLFCKELQNK